MNPMQIIQRAMQIKQQFMQQNAGMNMNPQQMIQDMLNSGKISQQQIEQARNIASMIQGFKM